MSKISASDLVFRSAAGATSASKADTPADALRRLDLDGEASKSWTDVLSLNTDQFATVIRTIDAERASLEHNYAGGTVVDTTLTDLLSKLDEADALVTANGKSGVSKYDRKLNQSDLDKVVKDIETLIKDAHLPDGGGPIFDGTITLTAGSETTGTDAWKVPKVSTHTMGHTYAHGRAMSLKDLVSRGLLDTAKDTDSIIADAHKVLKLAKEHASKTIEDVRAFQKEKLVPRLGDVATTMEGIYKSDAASTLVNSSSAQNIATQLRQILIDSAGLATTVGADGWDRERALALLS